MARMTVEEYQELYYNALKEKNWNDVVLWATELLKLDQNQPSLWGNRGIGLAHLGHPLDAILNHRKALELDGDTAIHHCNLGACYQELNQYEYSLSAFEKARSIDSTIPQIHMNIGHIYKWTKRPEEALESYRRCVECGPEYVDGRMSLAFMLLKAGYLEEGWREYEWRWKSDQLPPRGLRFPRWNGESLHGKSILVYGEQGLGDMIQFSRYVRELSDYYPGAEIVVEAKQPVKRLLQTIFDGTVLNFGEKLPNVDYCISMMSLAGMLTPTMKDIPSREKEFIIDPHDIETWGNKFSMIPDVHKNKIKVGICWAGMARMNNQVALKVDELRSLALKDFSDMAKIPEILWISLQKGIPSEQIKKPPAGMSIVDYTDDMYDFYESCAAIEHCDLVISVDTAVCHAAASIGKKTWMLSRWDGCWRWFDGRTDSPWYPSMKIFEQTEPRNWDGILKIMKDELIDFVKSKRSEGQQELDLTLAK